MLVIGAPTRPSAPPRCSPTALDVTPAARPRPAARVRAGARAARCIAGRIDALARLARRLRASTWTRGNPIDLDLCTRCNACIAVCPEAGDRLQLPDRPRASAPRHRDCVRVCEPPARSTSTRAPQAATESFDLVLDLRRRAADRAARSRRRATSTAGGDERRAVRRGAASCASWSASSRSRSSSTTSRRSAPTAATSRSAATPASRSARPQAIRSEATRRAGGIIVEPHLCVGCGACTTVCPSGALTYAYPRAARAGRASPHAAVDLRARRRARRRAAAPQPGGRRGAGRANSAAPRALDAACSGVPARVLPLALWHTASVGIDLWLAAIAYGARAGRGADDRRGGAGVPRRRWRAQMAVAQAILQRARLRRRRTSRLIAARRRPRRSTPRSPRCAPRGSSVPAQPARFARRRRQAHHARPGARPPAGAGAAGARRPIALPAAIPAGRRALRRDRRRHGHVHAVPDLRRRLPGQRAARQPERAAAALHREELRAVRPLREHLPGGRDHARSRACCSPTAARRASRRAC